MSVPAPPDMFEIDSIRYVVAQMENLEETLKSIEANHFGPDFQNACEMAYATRRYLEIELTQHEDAIDGIEVPA